MKTAAISTSRVSGEQATELVSTDSKHGSTLVFEDNSKCHEADTQSSDGIASRWRTSVKSEISTEAGLSFDSQRRTESSCSNSLSVVLPASFSSHNFQELRNYGSSNDSYSKVFDRSPEEMVTASSESGVSVQIARKAIRNARAVNRMKISSMDEKQSSTLTTKKGDEEISHEWDRAGEVSEISRNTSHTEEQHAGFVVKGSDCSDNSDNFNRTSKSVKSNTSCDGNNKNFEISGERGTILAVKSKPPEMDPKVMDKVKGDFWANESSESSMTKPIKVETRGTFIGGFDLNEDINANDMDDCIQPVITTTCHSVIHVVAKAGVPSGRPVIPLKFEGGLGWKGSSGTSAFRPAALSTIRGQKECFTGIDLNIVSEEDAAAANAHGGKSSPSIFQDPHSGVESKQAKSHWIDLNCLCDAADESTTQPSLLLKSENSPLVDLNLNVNTSTLGNPNNELHWLGRGRQASGNKTSEFTNMQKRDFDFNGQDYLPDLSAMQHHVVQNAYMPRVASLQPMLPFLSHSSTQQSPFHFGSRDHYSRLSHEQGIFPGILNSSTLHQMQVVNQEQSTNNAAAASSFKHDVVKTEDELSCYGSNRDEGRQFLFLSRSSPMGERVHQEAWYEASAKRKEPEGGSECCQLGYKQMMT